MGFTPALLGMERTDLLGLRCQTRMTALGLPKIIVEQEEKYIGDFLFVVVSTV